MKETRHHEAETRKKWISPELSVITGLDSCVEFLYGSGGNQSGDNNILPPDGF